MNDIVKSAARVLDLLEVFVVTPSPLGVTEVSRRLTIPKSSALGLLRTLHARAWLRRDESGLYRLSEASTANLIRRRVAHLVHVARPVMGRLVEATGETAFIGVLTPDRQVQYVDKVVSSQEIRYDAEIRTPRPAHLVSTGLVLLAFTPEQAATGRSGRGDGAEALEPELERVRRAGYAVRSDVRVVGASGVAAPIFGREERCIAALNVSAPTSRFSHVRGRLIQAVVDGAAEVTRLLRLGDPGGTTSTPRRAAPGRSRRRANDG